MRISIKGIIVTLAVAVLVFAVRGRAATLAFDTASDPAYAAGWIDGSNGGTGFLPWSFFTQNSPGGSSSFIGDATANGDGLDDGIIGGIANDGDINTADGKAWGLNANSGNIALAIRQFTGGALLTGQTLKFDFDNGDLDTGANVGVELRNAAAQTLWEMNLVGGQPNYSISDAAGATATTVGYSTEGLHVEFMMTSAASYSVTLTRPDGVFETINGNLINLADQGITRLRFYNINAGSGPSNDAFLNRLEIIPEPATFGLVGIGLLGALALRRRRK